MEQEGEAANKPVDHKGPLQPQLDLTPHFVGETLYIHYMMK